MQGGTASFGARYKCELKSQAQKTLATQSF